MRPTSPARYSARLVFLGASNLARDFPTVLATARELLTPAVGRGPIQVFTATGHGRSYGTWSRVFLVRGLPGIARCGLWPALEDKVRRDRGAAPPLYALLTDIGNDIAYGAEPDAIADWVESCLARLDSLDARTAMTLLPRTSLRRLPGWKFQLLRLLLFPSHATTYEQVQNHTEELQARLQKLATRFGAATVEPAAEWFGPDHIHFHLRRRRRVWQSILGPWSPETRQVSDGGREVPRTARLTRADWCTMTPELWRLAGVSLGRVQPARVLADDTEVWVY